MVHRVILLQMSILKRGLIALVSHEFLNNSQWDTSHDHLGCESMSQRVESDAFEPRLSCNAQINNGNGIRLPEV